MELYELTISDAHQLLKNKDISSRELTQAVLNRIDAVENKIDAFITVSRELALQQADQADAMLASGDSTPLTGIPLGIKDLMCTRKLATTCGSKILKSFLPPYDATVIQKLNAAGAVTVGKLNMDEFGMGSSTENSSIKITRNPWDPMPNPKLHRKRVV